MLCHCTALARSFCPQEHSSVELYYALSNDQRWGISFRFVHVFLLTASFAAITVMFINAHVCAELPIIRTLGTMRTKMFGVRCRAKKSKKDDALKTFILKTLDAAKCLCTFTSPSRHLPVRRRCSRLSPSSKAPGSNQSAGQRERRNGHCACPTAGRQPQPRDQPVSSIASSNDDREERRRRRRQSL